MYPELMNYLACPVDQHSPLSLDAEKVSGVGEIQSGTIHCPACGKAFEVRESIPCFVSDSDDKGAHGDEAECWKSEERAFRDEEPFGNTLPDPVAIAEFEGLATLLKLEKHHTLLDLGCGAGRITELFAGMACTTVAIDFSLAP